MITKKITKYHSVCNGCGCTTSTHQEVSYIDETGHEVVYFEGTAEKVEEGTIWNSSGMCGSCQTRQQEEENAYWDDYDD
jgi:translation initiation factor 2 gamma subunit (eIF-2gamma)